MKALNKIQLREPEGTKEKVLFSKIMDWVDEINFGNVSIEITVKNGKPTMISRIKAKETYSIYNRN